MAEIDQKERADAYYRNMVAMIFGARCELQAANEKHGADTMPAAEARNRLRALLNTVEGVERGEYHLICEACGKPMLDGHQAIHYEDAGDIHADCEYPTFASDDPPSHEFDSGFQPEQCAVELERAKALLAE